MLKNHGLLLLKCSGNITANETPQKRAILCDKIWQSLIESQVPIDIIYYNTYIKVCTENKIALDFKIFLAKMNEEPTPETYHLLLENAVHGKSASNTLDILETMKAANFPVSERVFNALTLNHGVIG